MFGFDGILSKNSNNSCFHSAVPTEKPLELQLMIVFSVTVNYDVII